MKLFLFIAFLFELSMVAQGQENHTITGVVRDASTNETLIYAAIFIEGTALGVSTDIKGKFSLRIAPGSYSLRCSYVGYKEQEISMTIQKDTSLNIQMRAVDLLLQDVTVYAYQNNELKQYEESALSMQSENIKSSTAIFPDVLRSIQMLPGVSTNNEFSAKFNARGGNQDENLVLVNGTQVYEPFHLKEAPNASLGIMNMDIVKKMDLMTGGFPARYGDKMSSVVNIEFREGNHERYHGSGSLSLTDADITAEGPIRDNGSFVVAARKSYLENIIRLINPAQTIHPSFYDVQGVIEYSITARDKLLLKFIHAGDEFNQDPTSNHYGPYQWNQWDLANTQYSGDSTDNRSQYYSTMFALQSINILTSYAIIRTELSYYDQREEERYWHTYYYSQEGINQTQRFFYNSYAEQLYKSNLHISTMELNSTCDVQLTPFYGVKGGISYIQINYYQDQTFRRTIDEFTNSFNYPDTTRNERLENQYDFVNNQMDTRSYKCDGYIENLIQLSEQLILNLGGRLDYFDLNKQLTWSPRINLAYQMNDKLALRCAWGYYYQSPNYRQIKYAVSCDTNTQAQLAIHYVLGAEYHASIDPGSKSFVKLKAELYIKKYKQLMNATQTSDGYIYYSRKNDAVGSSYGVDLYAMYSSSGFDGWISYGYLVASQNLLTDNLGEFPRYTDQRHTLAVVGTWGLGSRWSMNMRFVYGSGYPFTQLYPVYDKVNNQWIWISDRPNSQYLPSYARVDARVTKDFELFDLSTSVFIDISNLTNATNIQAYRYTFDSQGKPITKDVKLWPIIPTIGLSVRF